jgi:Fungal Zn(2)-Cys(6) binuclear cluster domain
MSESQDQRAQSQASINHHYDHQQDPHAQASHVQGRQDSVDQMVGQYGTPDGSMMPRKRSKVSRACDECRRKKIRCDATGEAAEESCTSCKRVGTTCQFSRVPMKRGPSKGYIIMVCNCERAH